MTRERYPFKAICRFELPQRTISSLEHVLLPEAAGEGDRTSVTLENAGEELVIKIGASDITGLRAAANSYLRWIECSLKVTQLPK